MPASDNNTAFEGIVAQRLTTIIGLLGGGGSLPVTGPFLTNDELRASPVPIYNKDVVAATTVSKGLGKKAILTLPNIGQYYNITFLEIIKYAGGITLGVDTPITITTNNLHDINFTFGTSMLMGESEKMIHPMIHPLRCQDNNADTVINCPETPNIIWRINVHYYISP